MYIVESQLSTRSTPSHMLTTALRLGHVSSDSTGTSVRQKTQYIKSMLYCNRCQYQHMYINQYRKVNFALYLCKDQRRVEFKTQRLIYIIQIEDGRRVDPPPLLGDMFPKKQIFFTPSLTIQFCQYILECQNLFLQEGQRILHPSIIVLKK